MKRSATGIALLVNLWPARNIFDVLFVAIQVICCLRDVRCELAALPIIGKPAMLSTTHSDLYAAGKAVDGRLDTFAHNALDDAHPVLRVDLGDEHCLGKITVTLRDTGCGPLPCFLGTVVRAGPSSNYMENQPCGLPGTAEQSGPGAVNEFLCETPRMARYVSLDIDPSRPGVTDPTLKIAEVEVEEYTAGECTTANEAATFKSAYFARLYKGGMIGNPSLLSTKVTRSLSRCAVLCLKYAKCFSFEFAQGNDQCYLHSLNSTDIEMSLSDDFSVYVLLERL